MRTDRIFFILILLTSCATPPHSHQTTRESSIQESQGKLKWPQGVLLDGKQTDHAISALKDFHVPLQSEYTVPVRSKGARAKDLRSTASSLVLLANLSQASSVAGVNKALESVNGRIAGMSVGNNRIIIAIPRQESEEGLKNLAATLLRSGMFRDVELYYDPDIDY